LTGFGGCFEEGRSGKQLERWWHLHKWAKSGEGGRDKKPGEASANQKEQITWLANCKCENESKKGQRKKTAVHGNFRATRNKKAVLGKGTRPSGGTVIGRKTDACLTTKNVRHQRWSSIKKKHRE